MRAADLSLRSASSSNSGAMVDDWGSYGYASSKQLAFNEADSWYEILSVAASQSQCTATVEKSETHDEVGHL